MCCSRFLSATVLVVFIEWPGTFSKCCVYYICGCMTVCVYIYIGFRVVTCLKRAYFLQGFVKSRCSVFWSSVARKSPMIWSRRAMVAHLLVLWTGRMGPYWVSGCCNETTRIFAMSIWCISQVGMLYFVFRVVKRPSWCVSPVNYVNYGVCRLLFWWPFSRLYEVRLPVVQGVFSFIKSGLHCFSYDSVCDHFTVAVDALCQSSLWYVGFEYKWKLDWCTDDWVKLSRVLVRIGIETDFMYLLFL